MDTAETMSNSFGTVNNLRQIKRFPKNAFFQTTPSDYDDKKNIVIAYFHNLSSYLEETSKKGGWTSYK